MRSSRMRVANPTEVVGETHALGNVVAEPPEVDDITAGARGVGKFQERRLEACRFQPEGERRSGNPGARNQDRLIIHVKELV